MPNRLKKYDITHENKTKMDEAMNCQTCVKTCNRTQNTWKIKNDSINQLNMLVTHLKTQYLRYFDQVYSDFRGNFETSRTII